MVQVIGPGLKVCSKLGRIWIKILGLKKGLGQKKLGTFNIWAGLELEHSRPELGPVDSF